MMCRPTASAAVQPKMRSAPAFQEVMTPSSVLLMIASSEESTRAARRAWVISPRRCGVMSRAILEAPTIRPASSLIGETVREMFSRCPFRATRMVSK